MTAPPLVTSPQVSWSLEELAEVERGVHRRLTEMLRPPD